MDGGVELDQILIAGQHERFLGSALVPAGAMLHVPLVSRRFGIGRSGPRAKPQLRHADPLGLHARQLLDRPWEFIVQAGRAVRQNLSAEALDDASLLRANDINAAQKKK